jgi:hypothetical protein
VPVQTLAEILKRVDPKLTREDEVNHYKTFNVIMELFFILLINVIFLLKAQNY